jgi:hypothetical protein
MSEHTELAENPMQAMRRRMLESAPAEFGIAASSDYPQVYGMLMDWPLGEHTASVVALCDGNASLYTTSTFGVIGGFGHENVRQAAYAFVRAGANYFDQARPAADFGLPPGGRVRFLLLSFAGVKSIDADLAAVAGGNHPLSALFGSGQALLTQLRLIAQTRQSEQAQPPASGAPSARRWSGAPGYLNCLLTLLCETPLRSVELAVSRRLPELTHLAGANADLRRWIDAQSFDYDRLKSKAVIEVLRQSARVRGLPFTTRQALLPSIHLQENAPALARIFEVRFRPFALSVSIERLADTDSRVVALQRQADAQGGGGAQS